MLRSDHVALVKRHALEYLEVSQITNAWLSFQREFPLHPDCRLTGEQIAQGYLVAMQQSISAMRGFINSFV